MTSEWHRSKCESSIKRKNIKVKNRTTCISRTKYDNIFRNTNCVVAGYSKSDCIEFGYSSSLPRFKCYRFNKPNRHTDSYIRFK